jgi:hypothetical protein
MDVLGEALGEADGLLDGDALGDGLMDVEGDALGDPDGEAEGLWLIEADGEADGEALGLLEGDALGLGEILVDGEAEGLPEGLAEGDLLGDADGLGEMEAEGLADGEAEGLVPPAVEIVNVGDPTISSVPVSRASHGTVTVRVSWAVMSNPVSAGSVIVTTVSLVRTTAVTGMSDRLAFQPVASDCADTIPSIIACRASSNVAKCEGDADGDADGEADGLPDGDALGLAEGDLDGLVDGLVDGDADGDFEGDPEGDALGEVEGDPEGEVEGLRDGEAEGDCDASPGCLNTPTMDTDLVVPVASTADIVPVAAVSVFTASATAIPLSAPVPVVMFILRTHVPVVGFVPVFRAPACAASVPEAVAGSVTASNAPTLLASPLHTKYTSRSPAVALIEAADGSPTEARVAAFPVRYGEILPPRYRRIVPCRIPVPAALVNAKLGSAATVRTV